MDEQSYLTYPIWKQLAKTVLKFILFLLVLIVVVIIGLVIGYTLIGKGSFWEVFNQEIWLHILDFLKA